MATNIIAAPKLANDDILTCRLCLHQLENPFTLQECLHIFCKDCIHELPKISEYDFEGWNCPLCKIFTAKDQVKHNKLLEKLVHFDNATKNHNEKIKHSCERCLGVRNVDWRCQDCKMKLCKGCHNIHHSFPFVKQHNMVLLDDTIEKNIVDELLFCSKHPSRVLEFNCKTCSVAMCALCKVLDHDIHPSEPVDGALNRILPEIDQDKASVTEKQEHLECKINGIRAKIEETKKSYAECKKQVNEQYAFLLKELEAMKVEQEDTLAANETEALNILKELKCELEAEVEGNKQLLNLCSITVDHCRNVSLLTELQAGLFEKLKFSSEDTPQQLAVSIPETAFTVSQSHKQKLKHQKVFGKCEVKMVKFRMNPDGTLQNDCYLCEDAHEYFQQSLYYTRTVQLEGSCNRISFFNDHIWVPLDVGLHVYDLSAELVDIFEFPLLPRVVKKVTAEEILVGTVYGLYHLNQMKPTKSVKLMDGQFLDLDVYGNLIYVLECNTQRIIAYRILERSNNTDPSIGNMIIELVQELAINTDFVSYHHRCNTLLRTASNILFSSVVDNCIFSFDTKGKLKSRFTSKDTLFLCGSDEQGIVITANFSRNRIFFFTENMAKVYIRCKVHQLQQPCDIVIDSQGNMWILEDDDDHGFQLVKYIVCD